MTTHFLATIKNGISYESNEPTLKNKIKYLKKSIFWEFFIF